MKNHVKKGANAVLVEGDVDGAQLMVGIGYSFDSVSVHEVDASAFLLGDNKRIRSDADFIFYNQRSDGQGGFIRYLPEVSSPDLDKHQFALDLARVPKAVHSIVFSLTIHDAELRSQNFSMANDVCLRVVKQSSGEELIRFSNEDRFTSETALYCCEIYRRGDTWKFRGVGQGYAGGLDAMARQFGVHLELPHVETVEVPAPSLDSQVPKTVANLEEKSELREDAGEEPTTLSKRKRRSSADLLAAEATEIRARMKPILSQINSALRAGVNESSSRLILDKVLQEVLGYSISEIKAEQGIQGRAADYVLAPAGVDTLVIEAKRVGLPLREKQIYQATGYAAHSGITWALLTNVAVWRLYKVTTAEKIEPHLVFTIDLHQGLTEDAAYYFALISRMGIVRKSQLERLWQTRRALSVESLISAILNDDVLVRIRNVISRENGIHLDLADIRAAVEQDILKLD